MAEPKTPTSPREPASPVEPTGPTEPGGPRTTKPARLPRDPSLLADDVNESDDEEEDSPCADFGPDKDAYDAKNVRNWAFIGFDREFIPPRDPPNTPPATDEEGMRWMYLSGSTRFTGIYLQGPRPSSGYVRNETDPTWVRNGVTIDRCWMAAFTMIDRSGWGVAPIYVGACNKLNGGNTLDEKLGRAHARHAKSLMALLSDAVGLDLAGSVVYLDNEDVQGKQEYKNICKLKEDDLDFYADYFRGFADELSLTTNETKAYRFGLYAHPSAIKLIATAVSSVYLWQVIQPKKLEWAALLTEEKSDPPLTVMGLANQSPFLQKHGGAPTRIWPVMRQFRLDIKIDKNIVKPPVAGMTIDLDSSFVLDPSEPIATPRLVFLPGTTRLVRKRTMLAEYNDALPKWQSTTRKTVRRGAISILESGATLASSAAAALDPPTTTERDAIHPESPLAATRDKSGQHHVAALTRDKRIIMATVPSTGRQTMEVVAATQMRRPVTVAITALDDKLVAASMTRGNQLALFSRTNGTTTWSSIFSGASLIHPLATIAISSDRNSQLVFGASITPAGGIRTVTADYTSGVPSTLGTNTASPGGPTLCATGGVAAISPTANDHLCFAIAEDGRLVMFFVTLTPGQFAVEASVKTLYVHSRLGVTVESATRVHVAGIDIDGNIRRWPVKKSGNTWALEDSVLVGKSTAAAPNPWSDVAITSTGVDTGFGAVAGVDESDADPQTRTHAFRAPFSPAGNAAFELTSDV